MELLWRCDMCGEPKAAGEKVPQGWLGFPETRSEVMRFGLCPPCRDRVWQAEMKQRPGISVKAFHVEAA